MDIQYILTEFQMNSIIIMICFLYPTLLYIKCPSCSASCLTQYSRLGAMLTHSCALGYNGAVLQALAVHLALQGALAVPQAFINSLISEMEDAEAEDHARSDARA